MNDFTRRAFLNGKMDLVEAEAPAGVGIPYDCVVSTMPRQAIQDQRLAGETRDQTARDDVGSLYTTGILGHVTR
jgi:tRNA U34 5-carboxymethylaminomethyl modifying GTPase MnmE/TrmE